MEYYEMGSLKGLIEAAKKYGFPIPEERIWKIISQFFIALAVMNLKNIVHRNIKDTNILIDENDNIKISMIILH
jgi:serine/threonine protein kinase